jgi:raffinose/stachyose/melibiose transport system permease protein
VRPLRLVRSWWLDTVALLVAGVVFVVPFLFILVTASKERAEASRLAFTWPTEWRLLENLGEVIGRGTSS